MAEYIEREAAIKAVSENDCEGYATWAIKAVPAANVRENVKGEWSAMDDDEDCFECSECDAIVGKRYRFCPNCGAQMMEVPDTDVGKFARDTNVPDNTVRIFDRGGIGLYNGQLVTNPNRLTNGDKFRAMSDEELAAEFVVLLGKFGFGDREELLDWLKAEVE